MVILKMLKMLIKYLHSRSYSELDIRIEGKIRNYKVRFVDSDVLGGALWFIMIG